MFRLPPRLTFALTLTPLVLCCAQAQQASPDWTVTQQGDNWVVVPRDLPAGRTFRMTVFPVTLLKNQNLETWLKTFIQKDSTKRGKILAPLQGVQHQDQMLVGSVGIQASSEQQVLLYVAIPVKQGQGQIFLLESSVDPDLGARYNPMFSRLVAAALKEYHPEQAQAAAGGQGNIALPAGSKPGGKLELGIYHCQTPGYQDQIIRFEVKLYSNGEYRIGKDNTGNWTYDARTGRLNIDPMHDLYNSPYSEEDFSVYLRDRNNKPIIYAQDGGDPTLCTYGGKTQDLSPTDQEAADQKKREEERRFKWVTTPGKGVQPNQMEGLLLNYELDVNPINNMVMQMPKLYLVLKDGTVYTGLRVPPEDLDVKASRKNEPRAWTTWKRQGKDILVQAGSKWNNIGHFKVVPAQKGEKLKGSFKHMASSFQAGLGGTTWTTYFTFDPKGKYEIVNSALSSTGMVQANNGFSSSASTTSDQNGTRSTVGTAGGGNTLDPSPGVVVTTQNNTKNPNPHLAGQYTLNGYTLQLKRGDGRLERKLFFFFDGKKDALWIEEDLYHSTAKE